MDLNKYDELRKKIHTKDFEGRNKSLDSWLYKLSFLGNIGSIFFAYFLVFPALNRAISSNLVSGNLGSILSVITTILILVSFETIKRILIKNLSFDLVKNKFKIIKGSILGWFIFSISIISLSFYLSLNGAKNFASTSFVKNQEEEINLNAKIDSVIRLYDNEKNIYLEENTKLREITIGVREKYSETPLNYMTARREYQETIDKNTDIINENENKIDDLNSQMEYDIEILKRSYTSKTEEHSKEDFKNIFLFILISTSIEILIIVGVYFREFYEYNLYILNQERLEEVYKKRDRYRAMLKYIYKEGDVNVGERVMGSAKLVELVEQNSRIANPKSFVDAFMNDMEMLGIFLLEGKRRKINATYQEALSFVENFDDALRILSDLN